MDYKIELSFKKYCLMAIFNKINIKVWLIIVNIKLQTLKHGIHLIKYDPIINTNIKYEQFNIDKANIPYIQHIYK